MRYGRKILKINKLNVAFFAFNHCALCGKIINKLIICRIYF